MILLLGGTSETSLIAGDLAGAGYRVLVSCATHIDLDVGVHEKINLRRGPLDVAGLVSLIKQQKINLVVDAAHPYATAAHATAREAAQNAGIPCLVYIRAADTAGEDAGIIYATDHNDAAKKAFAAGRPVLLTTGSRNLVPYATEAKKTNIPLIVRVLPEASSLDACRAVDIPEECIIAARGPFSVEENQEIIKRFAIGVVVTKDSGAPGGVKEKLEAAHLEGCTVIVVKRPVVPQVRSFADTGALLEYVLDTCPKD